ncbi:MAG TPA: hypothetical protein V6D12_07050 [Candidatus Obscuribacterales bacterium]
MQFLVLLRGDRSLLYTSLMQQQSQVYQPSPGYWQVTLVLNHNSR